jgi:hypothetical protein
VEIEAESRIESGEKKKLGFDGIASEENEIIVKTFRAGTWTVAKAFCSLEWS